MKKFAAILLAAMVLPSSANAVSLIQNGGFEMGPTVSALRTLHSGSTALTGWTVGGAGIDLIGTYWQAGEGSRSIDLSALNAGSIAQTFATVIGRVYQVDFLMAANQDRGHPTSVRSMNVLATGGATQQFDFDPTSPSGLSKANMGWTAMSYTFKATSTSTTLSFASLNHSAYGPALDGVSVNAVPEPATWAMMIGGFGLVGANMRRRKPAAAVRFA